MPFMVPIDAELAREIWIAAEAVNIGFDEMANRLVRLALGAETPKRITSLPPDWYELEVVGGVKVEEPAIYLWQVNGRTVYVGFYTKSSTALTAYSRNIQKLMDGRPYRAGKPDAFRAIHHELREALEKERSITLKIVENATPEDLPYRREAWRRREQNLF